MDTEYWYYLSRVKYYYICLEGKVAASSYDAKYVETSCVLKHHVDELLVGVTMQILYCLHCTVLYCTVLYCTILYSLYFTVGGGDQADPTPEAAPTWLLHAGISPIKGEYQSWHRTLRRFVYSYSSLTPLKCITSNVSYDYLEPEAGSLLVPADADAGSGGSDDHVRLQEECSVLRWPACSLNTCIMWYCVYS